MTDHQILLLNFDTNQDTVEQIADKVLVTFDSVTNMRLQQASEDL